MLPATNIIKRRTALFLMLPATNIIKRRAALFLVIFFERVLSKLD
ncbi:MAG: hypothetical protein ACK5NI_00555 [bacterium]